MPDRTTALHELEIPTWPDERRATVRRQDDRSLIQKCRTLANDLGKLIAVATALIIVVGWLAALLGVRLQGPPQTIAAMAVRVDSLDRRVGRLETGTQETQTQLGNLSSDVRFLSYQMCVRDGGSDQVAVKRCETLIRSFRSPQ